MAGNPQNVLTEFSKDPEVRKNTPITSGVLDYFPLALIQVARVSEAGNRQHNPGQPLHWNRSKSSDHADCITRHLMERGTIDNDGQRHSAKLAWRALALLQEEIEADAGFDPSKHVDNQGSVTTASSPGIGWSADIPKDIIQTRIMK